MMGEFMTKIFTDAFQYKLIYIFAINDKDHKDILKIGDASIATNLPIEQLSNNCKVLNDAAKKRISEYTKTAAVNYQLLHTELAVKTIKTEDGELLLKSFRDYDVHSVLTYSGIKRKKFPLETSGKEWFYVDLTTAKKAIEAVKKSQITIDKRGSINYLPEIVFRPEQEEAIKRTVEYFEKKGNSGRMLWNAKMRFGKTLTTLQVIKEMKFNKSIILTHRPVVSDSWEEDFYKIFSKEDGVQFASKKTGYIDDSDFSKLGDKFVYFASIQDLRGSAYVDGKFKKNDNIFDLVWDLVVVDEAHEGTQTALGADVITAILTGLNGEKKGTKLLSLSGTPFNILDKYDENAVYTWDYIQEQDAKEKWDINHFGDSNPYSDLPKMHIYTYDLGKLSENPVFISELSGKAFNFSEFFKIKAIGQITEGNPIINDDYIEFVHKEDVLSFLNLLTKEDEESNYPYSNEHYRSLFRHSLWMVPGVKEAKALKQLMQQHKIFGNSAFRIINVAGSGDEEITESELATVKNAIKEAGQEGYTITISCGRLTTGVTVPEWTAVFMLSGSYSTSAANYLQTIFRVQSPCNTFGKVKTDCYVFDFAPDRTLKMVADAVAVSPKAGRGKSSDNKVIGEFLNYCPVISFDGTKMVGYKTDSLLQQLKKAYADKAVRTGFDDNSIYSYDELINLTDDAVEEFENLKGIIGSSTAQEKTKDITVNDQGFTEEEREKIEKISKKKKKELTEEEKEALDKLKELRKNRRNAISILRGISIRMPLLIYGADIDFNDNFNITDFLDDKIVDSKSWEEFMPKGVSKELFRKFIKYYDKDVFVAASRKIRAQAKDADLLSPTERVQRIASIFSYFKNPDKETVLTPWRVVNMHLGTVFGGYNFYDESYTKELPKPRLIDNKDETSKILTSDKTCILEINSKTGLYPLYVAYSLYRTRLASYNEEVSIEEKNKIWEDVLRDNVFIICKTPMAKSITKRTLTGYKDIQVNTHYFDNLVSDINYETAKFVKKVLKPSTWKKDSSDNMKFDAIVGNPPYQENISNKDNSSLAKQLFPYFIMGAIKLNAKYVSLITPSRWFTADAQDKSFLKLREFIKKHNHIRKIYNFSDNKNLFKGVEIGAINFFLYEDKYVGDVDFYECDRKETLKAQRPLFEDGLDIILSMNDMVSIINKIRNHSNYKSFSEILYGRNAFGVVGKESSLKEISVTKKFENAVTLFCAHEEIRYIDREKIVKNKELIDKWKVFTSKGNGGAGVINNTKAVNIIGKAFVGAPNTVCTDSLIPIGPLEGEIEAQNVKKYMATKFLRFLIGILKVSQNIYQNVYKFVPMQDFSNNSDIDWKKSISDIDKQLYKKYELSVNEISFIEEKILPMKGD